MEAYLDNSATTQCYEEVKDVVVKTMTEDYGNPSSMHLKGVEAEKYEKESKQTIARLLKVTEQEIYFTSGGTESNNLAVIGTAMANRRAGNHIITSSVEHPSVSSPVAYLEELGFRVTILPVNSDGIVDIEFFSETLCDETILVSVMHVNNEVGAVQPIEQISNIIKEKNKKAVFHVDAVQSFGKYRIYPKRHGIDLLSVSGHKIHGPKGIGFLYKNDRVKVNPVMLGGGQQKGLRSGTDNVPGIAGIGKASELVYDRLDEKRESYFKLKKIFIEELKKIDECYVNGPSAEEGAPHIINVSFPGIRSEVLLHSLEDRGIYISAGSACSSNKRKGSSVLTAMNIERERMESAVRFSLCEFTSEEEIRYAGQVLNELVPMLRRYVRR